MLVVYSTLVVSPDLENRIIIPSITKRTDIADQLDSVINGLGQVTIFNKPGQTGQSLSTMIGPQDFMEARELSPKAQERFVRGVLDHIDQSPCVVFRWLPPVPKQTVHKQTPREVIKSML